MKRFLLLALVLSAACARQPEGHKPREAATGWPVEETANAPAAPVQAAPEPAGKSPVPKRAPPRPARPTTTASYRAIGTEPFWAVTVTGNRLTLETPDRPPRRFAVRISGKKDTMRLDGEGVRMTVTPGPCSDGMSETVYADRVQIALSDRVLKGCGAPLSGSEGGE